MPRSPRSQPSPALSPGGVVVYEAGGDLRLDVRTDGETVWLNRRQMATLFGRDVKTIGKHIANALAEELAEAAVVAKNATTGSSSPVVAKFATVAADGKTYQVEYYGLDVILSVGYRVKSPQGILFRRWANYILREMLLRKLDEVKRIGSLERRMDKAESDIDQVRNGVSYLVQQLSTPPPDPPKPKIGFQARR